MNTPRTDAAKFQVRSITPIPDVVVYASFAETIESELAEVTKQRDAIEEKLAATCAPLHKFVEAHDDGTACGHHVATEVVKLAELFKEQRDALSNSGDELRAEFLEVRDQRDALADALSVIKTIASPPHHERAFPAIMEIASNTLKGETP
jgi:hypothetical protein